MRLSKLMEMLPNQDWQKAVWGEKYEHDKTDLQTGRLGEELTEAERQYAVGSEGAKKLGDRVKIDWEIGQSQLVKNLLASRADRIVEIVRFLATPRLREAAYGPEKKLFKGTCKKLLRKIEDRVYADTKGSDAGAYGLSKEQTRTILDLCRKIVGPRDRSFLGLGKQDRGEAAPSAAAAGDAPAPEKK